jgi:hypothetical protein
VCLQTGGLISVRKLPGSRVPGAAPGTFPAIPRGHSGFPFGQFSAGWPPGGYCRSVKNVTSGLGNSGKAGLRTKIILALTALAMVVTAAGQNSTTPLSLRADVNTCFNNGSTSRTLSTSEGSLTVAEPINLGTSGSISYDFYSAPLVVAGPAITTSDKVKLKLTLTNSTAVAWRINLSCAIYDYDPVAGTQTSIATASGTALQLNPSSVGKISTGTDGVSPGTAGIPAGHLIKATITLTRNSGSVVGQFLYGLNSAAELDFPWNRAVTWSFGSFAPVTSISRQPSDQTVCVGMGASFSVAASSSGPVLYQWRKNGVNLADCPTITGSSTATLTIAPCANGDAAVSLGGYDCLVTSSCGAPVVSSRAALIVNAAPGPLSLTGTPPGALTVGFSGTPGVTYRLQATPDLANPVWSFVSTNTANGTGWVSFVDFGATNYPARFYRAVFP